MSNVLLNFVMEEWLLLFVLTVLFALYFHYTSTFGFFEEKGIKFMKPTIVVGNLASRLFLKESFHKFQKDIYDHFAGLPYGGFFEGQRPILLIRDPDLIKAVMIRDFEYFVDRNSLQSNEPNYLRKSLLNLKGHEWKNVRSVLTPTFSSARLRAMLPIINHCSTQMVELLRRQGEGDVEMKEFMGRFTLEVIGTCAFGIECAALKEEPSHFVKVAEKFAEFSIMKRLTVFFLLLFIPQAFPYIDISFLNRKSTDELIRMLNVTKNERRSGKGKDKTNDFLQLLIEAAEAEGKRSMDEDTLDAQALLFLIAGYETSSTLLSFAAHVLATQPEIQEKLRQHVIQVLKENDNQLDYETIAKMDYLESFLLETLRRYPPVSRVDRKCTKSYTLPGTAIQLKEGDIVAVPVYGIHMDELYYPQPQQFRPERFSHEEKKERPSHLYLPFGAGPRNCIGLRFAMVSTKLALAALIKEFKFTKCEKTVHPVVFEKRGFLLKSQNGLWVNVSTIN